MSPSKIHFDKELEQLQYSDIVGFFSTEQPESDSLEFKSFTREDMQKQELRILENIAAMLNSDGGLIIWGTPQEKRVVNRKEKVASGELVPIPSEHRVEKGRFFNRIGAEITPIPSGIRFRELEGSDNYVYLIEVDKSLSSPHQYNKTIYPMRMGANAIAAPHHYVEALFKKITYPSLFCKLEEENNGEYFEYTKEYRYEYKIEVSNQSNLLNEENLFLSITVTEGKLDPGNLSVSVWSKRTPKALILPDVQPILFYGAPYFGSFKLTLDSKTADKLIFIKIRIGGKNSPLKEFIYSHMVSEAHGRLHSHNLKLVSENHLIGEDIN